MSWKKKSLQQLTNHLESLLRRYQTSKEKMILLKTLPKEMKKNTPILWKFVLLKNTIKRCREQIRIKKEEIRMKKELEQEDDEVSDIEFSDSSSDEFEDDDDTDVDEARKMREDCSAAAF